MGETRNARGGEGKRCGVKVGVAEGNNWEATRSKTRVKKTSLMRMGEYWGGMISAGDCRGGRGLLECGRQDKAEVLLAVYWVAH